MLKLWRMLKYEKPPQEINQVKLTDSEITLILASLELTEAIYDDILKNNSELKSDIKTKEYVDSMKELNHRLNSEYNKYYI